MRLACFVASTALVVSACNASYITAPHQPYAPLLDNAGQVDLTVRAGPMSTNGMSAAVHAAYAPIDHLEIAASVDADFLQDEYNRTAHVGGGLAIGSFTRTDVLRVEGLVGLNGGYAEGYGHRCTSQLPDEPCMEEDFDLSGPYVQPFIQGAIGFEVPYFEFAGGLRIETQVTEVTAVGDMGTREDATHVRSLISPFIVLRVPVQFVRFELMMGMSGSLNGNVGPLPGTYESTMYFYALGGIGFQFDTMIPPEPPPPNYVGEPLVY